MAVNLLVAWIGNADLRAARGESGAGLGPIGQAVAARSYAAVHLLSDHKPADATTYAAWLRARTPAPVEIHPVKLSGPTQFGEIYETALSTIDKVRQGAKPKTELTYHLSPGTPAMAAVWILIAKTARPAELIESSPDKGVRTVSFPFELSADYWSSPRKTDTGLRVIGGLRLRS